MQPLLSIAPTGIEMKELRLQELLHLELSIAPTGIEINQKAIFISKTKLSIAPTGIEIVFESCGKLSESPLNRTYWN